MADLSAAIANSREAGNALRAAIAAKFENLGTPREAEYQRAQDDCARRCAETQDALLAALDATQGEAVALDAWLVESRKAREEMRARLDAADSIKDLPDLARVYRAGFEAGRTEAPPAAVPAGYVLVPVEPTQKMVKAFQDQMLREFGMRTTAGYHGRVYRAMLAAAKEGE